MEEEKDIFILFKQEAIKLMDSAQEGISSLKKNFSDQKYKEIFSNIHTVKGEAGFFGFTDISETLHSAEDSLISYSNTRNTILLDTLVNKIKFVKAMLQSLPEGPVSSVEDMLSVFNNFINNYSKSLGKQVEFLYSARIESDITDVADIKYIQHILIQILKNAIEHGIQTPEAREKEGKNKIGKIELTINYGKDDFSIICSDDGVGIENPNKVFDFGFTSKPTADTAAGRGVGLFSVKTIVEHKGGTIKINSKKGVGTEVWIALKKN